MVKCECYSVCNGDQWNMFMKFLCETMLTRIAITIRRRLLSLILIYVCRGRRGRS